MTLHRPTQACVHRTVPSMGSRDGASGRSEMPPRGVVQDARPDEEVRRFHSESFFCVFFTFFLACGALAGLSCSGGGLGAAFVSRSSLGAASGTGGADSLGSWLLTSGFSGGSPKRELPPNVK